MRIHVLGLGPIGQLLAFHLRKNLAQKQDVVLMLKDAQLARQMASRPIQVELEGAVSSVEGFNTEVTGTLDGRDRLGSAASLVVRRTNDELHTRALANREAVMESDRTTNAGSSSTSTGRPYDIQGTPNGDKIDSLFIACKAHSTLQAIQQLYHRLSPNCTIVLMQNGNLAVHRQLMRDVFGPTSTIRPHFVLSSITHGVWLKHLPCYSQVVVHAGVGQILFGIVPSGKRRDNFGFSPRYRGRLALDDIVNSADDPERQERYASLRNVVAVLRSLAELQPLWCTFPELQLALRRKLAVNAVINPITTVLCCRNGEIESSLEARRIAGRICHEAAKVFAREMAASPGRSVPVPQELHADVLFEECMRVAHLTADNTSSMLADVLKGKRETEIDYLNGYLVLMGARYGLRLPTNATMVDMVKMRTEIPLDLMV